jgi:putative ABC transport system substrate-binding protein
LQTDQLRRREFITLFGGAAAALPLAARAQQSAVRIGFVRAAPAPESTLSALRQGLAEHGYLEGQRYVLVPSWGDGAIDRLPALASALVRSKVDIILTDGTETALAARQVTDTIPIVMAGGRDPVAAGLAANLSHPGGNVTGFTTQVIELTGKTFEILSEIYPGLRRIAVINPIGAGVPFRPAEAEAAQALKLELSYVVIRNLQAAAIDSAIREAVASGSQAAVVRGSPFLSTTQRRLVVEAAAAHRFPTVYETREFVELGGLLSYGTDFSNLFRLAAGYVVRILNGAKPADLPIEQATKFELVINLKTAKAIGLDLPPIMLTRADEVIE